MTFKTRSAWFHWCWNSKLKNFKSTEIEIISDRPELAEGVLVTLSFWSIINFDFSFFDLIGVSFEWTRRVDHAGQRASFTLLGTSLSITRYDCRHWDDENNDYYPVENI